MHRTSSSAGTESATHPQAPRRKLYFVRHGETDWNAERRLQGRRDIPLNALGREQAARCGGLLRNLLADKGDAFGPVVDNVDFAGGVVVRPRAYVSRDVRRHVVEAARS